MNFKLKRQMIKNEGCCWAMIIDRFYPFRAIFFVHIISSLGLGEDWKVEIDIKKIHLVLNTGITHWSNQLLAHTCLLLLLLMSEQ